METGLKLRATAAVDAIAALSDFAACDVRSEGLT